jgi:hypothetical protein
MARKKIVLAVVPWSAVAVLLVMLSAQYIPNSAAATRAAAAGEDRARGAAVRLTVPASIKHEHEELHVELRDAVAAGGKTGAAAETVEKLLRPHFEKEEQFALPPLSMLRAFVNGEAPANAEDTLAVTERFRREYETMLEEHEAIVAALKELESTATAEGKTAQANFARRLRHHAATEEEVLYPTTLLIGEYLKLRLAR